MEAIESLVVERQAVTPIKVSISSHKKLTQLRKFMNLSASRGAWGVDQKLLRCNLLLVPSNINYKVILAMGRENSFPSQ